MKGYNVTYQSSGLDLPALIEVNRVEPIAFTRTEDVRRSYADGSDTLTIEAANQVITDGTMDTVEMPIDNPDASTGELQFHYGTHTDNVDLDGPSSRTVTLTMLDTRYEPWFSGTGRSLTLRIGSGS